MSENDAPNTSIPCEIVALYIYPVKSLGGAAVAEVRVGEFGLQSDRQWAVIGPDGRRLSARKYPRLATIKVSITKDGLRLSHLEGEEMIVEGPARKTRSVRLTDTLVDDFVQPAAPQVSAWISAIVGLECELVQMSSSGSKALALFPVHIVSMQSIAEINRWLAVPIEAVRFRPNMVINGIEAFEEDKWRTLSIGGVRMRVVDLTDRCSVPNINPDAGVMSAEPLKTLAKFRRSGSRINFGIYAHPSDAGTLRVGMKIAPSVAQ